MLRMIPDIIGARLPAGRIFRTLAAEMLYRFRRFQICAVGPGPMNHFLKHFRIFQHWTRAEMILIKRLALMVSHKQRALQNFKNGHIVDIRIGIMDKYTRFRISGRIDMEIIPSSGDTAAHVFTVILEIHWEEFNIRFG